MDPALSIIVPVYNGAPFIGSCLGSILEGADADIEVVVIDDGSTDDTARICQELARNEPRLQLLSQANTGVSVSRNRGIELARGDYVMFVDGDDMLAPGWMETVRPHLGAAGGTDVVCFLTAAEREHYGVDELVSATIGDACAPGLPWLTSPCAKLYRRQFLHERHVRFDPRIMYGEDALFNIVAQLSAESYRVIGRSIYRYRTHPGSVTHTYDARFLDSNERYLSVLEETLTASGRYSAARVRELVDLSFVRSVALTAIRTARIPVRAERREALRYTRRHPAFVRRLRSTRPQTGSTRAERTLYALTACGGPTVTTALVRAALMVRAARAHTDWVVV